MAQVILILLIIAVAIVGAVFLVEAWNGQQDARAQRIAEEARLATAKAEGDAARTRANAEASVVRSDATARMLMAMFPWLIVFVISVIAVWAGYALVNRQQAMPARQPADILALAALGRMWLAQREQERIAVPARAEVAEAAAVLESRNQEHVSNLTNPRI